MWFKIIFASKCFACFHKKKKERKKKGALNSQFSLNEKTTDSILGFGVKIYAMNSRWTNDTLATTYT